MKKGLLFVPFMTGKGGTETVIHNLFEAYNKVNVSKEYEISVYSVGGSQDYNWTRPIDKINIKYISDRRIVRTLYYLTFLPGYLFRVLKKEKPDFVISTNPVMWFLSFYITKCLSLNTKIVSWYHYSLKRKPVKTLFLKAADYYLAISNSIKEELIQNGVDKSRIYTIYNPIITNGKVIKRPISKTRFIYLGRLDLNGQKNLQDLIDACSLLKGEWSLELYGDETNAEVIKKYAQQKSIKDSFTFHGFVNEPWDKINEASALVLCSKFEGYPMVIAEAMSHGVFCIASDIDGSNELINDHNGKMYQLGHTKELAKYMQRVINNPSGLPAQREIQQSVNKLLPQRYIARFNDSIREILKNRCSDE
ncbi:glycosyltransferase [Limosilactobacillus panis]|uniref:glycosyltransferase n=1 Tax=Limosilactobacillus panis TaxID=47493 RepID=UPI001C984155|nr:glycosyltransferase [Limosilactobacillus panis]QZN92596.1 glycosyltransferase [Limosilactobacillus panis]